MTKYQICMLGPNRSTYEPSFRTKLKSAFNDFGLDSEKNLEFITTQEESKLNWIKGFPVAGWFGKLNATNSQKDLRVLETFLEQSSPVFPIVKSTPNFTKKVPHQLHKINGQEWNDELPSQFLRAFGLTRKDRQAFISYYRAESSGVAVQLFESLFGMGYAPFLDVTSVSSGDNFQDSLWSRLCDVDLLIFLDSPKALSSRWVREELTRAESLGMGILQLVWPNHQRTHGTELCDHLQLGCNDFLRNKYGKGSKLKKEKLKRILKKVEQIRIRSLCSRRMRIIDDIENQVQKTKLTAKIHAVDGIDIYKSGQKVGHVIPSTGIPTSIDLEKPMEGSASPRIIYDNLGVCDEKSTHLNWLNRSLKTRLKTLPLSAASKWLKEL